MGAGDGPTFDSLGGAVRKIVTRRLAFDAVRAAFEAVATDRARAFDVAIGYGLHPGEASALKSSIDCDPQMVGFKCGTYWPDNFDKDMPVHSSAFMDITVFHSSGIAIQALTVAGAILEAARQMSRVQYIDF